MMKMESQPHPKQALFSQRYLFLSITDDIDEAQPSVKSCFFDYKRTLALQAEPTDTPGEKVGTQPKNAKAAKVKALKKCIVHHSPPKTPKLPR